MAAPTGGRPDARSAMHACGLVLAAGAGTRFGGPKGLARTADGMPWVELAVRMLHGGGCDRVIVLVGARGDDVAALVPPDTEVVTVPDWSDGVSATLRTGLAAASVLACDAVVVTPVDTPDAAPAAVVRVLAALGGEPRDGLAQAVYDGRPGHPVAIGAHHLDAVAATVTGDRGARPYLAAHGVTEVECGDLWSGADIDTR
jgi:CTP:molybdopterin cytidylyltransferase MocA